jgi:protein tyrosine phosphatase (PTP) superfamily phosphohydrolase (DUF442 family)
MAVTLSAFLGRALEMGEIEVAGPLTVAPLFAPRTRAQPALIGLAQAIGRGAVARELPEPEVGRIRVENPTEVPLLLLDGEEIVGAQQNRVVDGSVVVPARSRRVVAVCCVEEHRWDGSQRGEAFRASRQFVPTSVRVLKSRTARAAGRGDQTAVWREVRSHVEATRTSTQTGAIADVFDAHRGELDDVVAALVPRPGQVGMVVAVGSRVWAVDLVADPALFASVQPRLLRGYAIDALHAWGRPKVAREELAEALRRLVARPLVPEPGSDGLEQRYRFGGDGVVEGSALAYGGTLVAVGALLPGAPRGGGERTSVRTSETDPIEVSWLGGVPRGELGITFAPGKRASSALGAPWERDLELDLLRLRAFHRVDTLVCLVTDDELSRLGMGGPAYAERVRAHGMELLRLPIRDGGVPTAAEVAPLVAAVRARLAAEGRVVVHCRGGLGRAGTIAGCVLVDHGQDAAAALERLAQRRSRSCPETAAQRAFVASYGHAVEGRSA